MKEPARVELGPIADLAIALACTYCKDRLARAEVVHCASCLAPHHADCFAEHGRCAACGARELVHARRPRRLRGALAVLLLFCTAGLVATSARPRPALHVVAVGASPTGTVAVTAPHLAVLALSAREPTRFVVSGPIERVLLCGKGPHEVSGLAADVPVSRVPELVPYSPDDFTGEAEALALLRREGGDPRLVAFYEERLAEEGPGYRAAIEAVERRTGLRVASFQGELEAERFVVGGVR